jgi:hypothetical protein
MYMHNIPKPDDFKTYLNAHKRAYSWARKGELYRSKGKFDQAKAAVENLQKWLRRIAILECDGEPPTLYADGRTQSTPAFSRGLPRVRSPSGCGT